jgi:hypothetical protein
MNLLEAKKILELPSEYTPADLKSNYRRLAKLYHPDKNPDGAEQFIKIQDAYEYLNKEPEQKLPEDIIGDILKSFNFNLFRKKETFTTFTKEVKITPLEYFTGVTKEIKILNDCNCQQVLCPVCYHKNLNCKECFGVGYVKTCSCPIYKILTLKIGKLPNLGIKINNFKIVVCDERYKIINGKMTYTFDITLKESLVGFCKTFKDPFEKNHTIEIKTKIIKQNDGYSIQLENGETLVLLFNIIYPTKISKSVKKVLISLEF